MVARNKELLYSWPVKFHTRRNVINESKKDNDGFVILQGLSQKANVRNGNGRLYPRSVLSNAVRSFRDRIRDGEGLGELDHPDETEVMLQNACWAMVECEMKGDDVYGTYVILNTSRGRDLSGILEVVGKVGTSSRGLGTLIKEGNDDVVQPDLELICWDAVAVPSTPNAYVKSEGVNESVGYGGRVPSPSEWIDAPGVRVASFRESMVNPGSLVATPDQRRSGRFSSRAQEIIDDLGRWP